MKTVYYICLSVICHLHGYAQNTYEHGHPFYPIPKKGEFYINIQHIEINRNKFLLNEIKTFIKEQTDSNKLFRKGFGFIVVKDIQTEKNKPIFSRYDLVKEPYEEVRFSIGARSYLLTQSFISIEGYCYACFPDYYSIIDGRLVLFYSSQSQWIHHGYFSESSKAKLIELQRECLKQALNPDFVYIDLFGKEYQIDTKTRSRLTEQEQMLKASLTLQTGKTVVQYSDGRVQYQY